MCVMLFILFCVFFFFKQKTAYEMRISDWSSDVCSSDLVAAEPDRMTVDRRDHRHLAVHQRADHGLHALAVIGAGGIGMVEHADAGAVLHAFQVPAGAERLAVAGQIGRESCRERGWSYVLHSEVRD